MIERRGRRGGAPAITRALLVLMVPAVIALTGCPRPPPGFGPEPYEEAEAVLAAAGARQFVPEALIADARLRVAGPAGRGSADHFVVVRAPSDLRLEILSFFGNPIALVLVVDGTFLLWELEAGRAWEGAATAENLSTLLPISLEPEEVASLLLGAPVFFEEERRLDLDHQGRRYVVSQRRGSLWQQVVVRPEDQVIEELRWYDEGGEVSARLYYDRHQPVADGRLFPHEIRYETADGMSLRVLYRDVTFDPDPAELERLFGVRPSEHVRIMPLDQGRLPPSLLPESEED